MNPDNQRLAVMVAVSTLVLVLVLLFVQLRELKALVEERALAPFETRGSGVQRALADYLERREHLDFSGTTNRTEQAEGGAP